MADDTMTLDEMRRISAMLRQSAVPTFDGNLIWLVDEHRWATEADFPELPNDRNITRDTG